MSAFKSFDFFQKFSVDGISKPTMIGSLLSICAIGLMTAFLLKEFYEYSKPIIVTDSIIYHDLAQDETITMNLFLKFPYMPCGVISVDNQDAIGNHRMDISDTLKKRYTYKNGTITTELHISNELDDVNNAVNEEKGCVVQGHIDITKVPGNVHISHHGYRQLWDFLRHSGDKYNKLTLNHQIMALNFGDYKTMSDIFKRFGYEDMRNEFNRADDLPDFKRLTHKKNYDYFLKLIPVLFVDEVKKEKYLSYKYSLNYVEKEYEDKPHEQHIIMINYDFSPITTRITRKAKYLSQVAVDLCAVVGGIFVIFSILNRILVTCFDSGEKK